MARVTDTDCAAFLQWALPRIDLRWAGFCKVRGQVCKRIKRRMAEIDVADFDAYRARLEAEPAEWRSFEACCHVTISRFFRDIGIFESLRRQVLPAIAARARAEQRHVRIWSAGCAAGEEPYTLRIVWDLDVAPACPGVGLSIVATDVDRTMLARARKGCFEATSLHELPPYLVEQAFDQAGSLFCVKPRHRVGIEFLFQDLRADTPVSTFDLILCRNLAFTYFAPALQRRVLAGLLERLLPGGYLVIGSHERLPEGAIDLVASPASATILERRTIPSQS